jgi:alanine dehydrogenase
MSAPVWLTERDVVDLISLEEGMEALETGLARLSGGGAASVPKAMHAWAGGNIHALGSYDPVANLAAFKSWINTPAGAVSIMTVFDAERGALKAVIESAVLGAIRTSGVTGLATRELAAADADEATIIGSGRQAQLQLAAIALARPLKKVRFWSPTPAKREAAAEAARLRFALDTVACATLDDALRDAPIVATVTRAKDPFLSMSQLARGAHLNAVGAILPGFAEVEAEVFAQADIVVADSVAAVSPLREMTEASALAGNCLASARDLSELLTVPGQNRPASPRLTVFKSVGIGSSDLAVAAEVLARAQARNVGRPIDNPQPVPPRWRKPNPESSV